MSRSQFFTLLVGAQKCGKSTKAKKIADAINSKGKPVLCILPDDDEKIFWDIEEIDYEDDKNKLARELYYFRSGIKKIICEDEKIFYEIRKYFRNGLILIDDARLYLSSRPEEFRRMIMRRRQSNNDVLFMCHGLSEIPPSVETFINDIILFRTTDSDVSRWNVGKPERFIPIVNRINQIALTKDKYYSERIIVKPLD